MAGGASEVHKTTTGEDDDSVTIGEEEAVNLLLDGLDDHAGVTFKTKHVDLVVEVTNVTNDGVVLHLGHVGSHDDSEVSGGGNKDIGGGDDGGQTLDLEAFHAGLKSTDGVALSDDDAGTARLHGGGAALADITVSEDNNLLAGDHDVSGTHETVREGVTTSVDVVELLLGDGIVDVDSLDEELSTSRHLLKSVDTGGSLFRDSLHAGDHLAPLLGVASLKFTAEDSEHLLHLGVVGGSGVGKCSELLELLLGLHTFVHDEGGITTVIDEDIRAVKSGPR